MTAAAAMGEGVAPSQSPVSEPLPAAPSLQTQTQTQTQTQSPAPGTPILEEASADAAMKKRKMQKVAALALAQNPTFKEEEEQGEEAVLAAATTRKKHKEHISSPSLSAAAAAETPPMEHETKVSKKPKRSKEEEEPPGHSPLPPGQAQSQGTKAPHASKPLPAATFFEALAQSPAPGTPMLEDAAAVVMSKRNICKEQKVPELSLAQITTLEEPRDDAMAAKIESNPIKHTLSSPSTSVAAETTFWEQEVKVTKKQKHSKDQELSSYSLLPLDPRQTQPQGSNAPHASKPLSAGPFREATAQSAASGTPMLKEVAAAIMMKSKISKEQKLPDPFLAQNTSLEEQRVKLPREKIRRRLLPPCPGPDRPAPPRPEPSIAAAEHRRSGSIALPRSTPWPTTDGRAAQLLRAATSDGRQTVT